MKCSGKNCPMQYPYDEKACAILETCPYATLIPYTNADRIRAMSDEELAIWLAEWSFCADACPASTNEVEEAIGYHCPSNCKEQALTWLQQPAEEET